MTRKLLAGVLLAAAAAFAFPTFAAAAGDTEAAVAGGADLGGAVLIAADGQMLALWASIGGALLAAAYISVMVGVRRSRASA